MGKKPWIQAAIDVTDIELAKKIAFMALDNGAEWLEVGTPLLYQYGHSAIKMIRDAVGKNAVLVADYKAPFALLAAEQASRAGADYIMLFTTYYDFLIEHSIKTCEKYDIQPIFDLEVKQEDLPSCIEKVRSKGGKYIITRHYSIYGDSISNLTKSDNFPLFEKDRDYYLGITSDNLANIAPERMRLLDLAATTRMKDIQPFDCKMFFWTRTWEGTIDGKRAVAIFNDTDSAKEYTLEKLGLKPGAIEILQNAGTVCDHVRIEPHDAMLLVSRD